MNDQPPTTGRRWFLRGIPVLPFAAGAAVQQLQQQAANRIPAAAEAPYDYTPLISQTTFRVTEEAGEQLLQRVDQLGEFGERITEIPVTQTSNSLIASITSWAVVAGDSYESLCAQATDLVSHGLLDTLTLIKPR